MTVSTIKSENITNIEAVPQVVLDGRGGSLLTMIDKDAIPTTSVDEIGDIMLFGPIQSNWKILGVMFKNDALDSDNALTCDVGLYYSGIGGNQEMLGKTFADAVDVDCFANASTNFRAAKLVWTDLQSVTDDIVDTGKEAWEIGGLTSDPGGIFYLGLTVDAAATSADAGDIVVRIDYIA